MSASKRQREIRMPRVLTPQQIAKLSDHGLTRYRKTALDRRAALDRLGRWDPDRHRPLTYLLWETDREMERRGIGRYAAWDHRGHVDDPSTITATRPRKGFRLDWHCPLRAQREGHRRGRRMPRGPR